MRPKAESLVLPPHPDLSFERKLWKAGYPYIAGIDEAGRGAWAGPVAAAAVIFQEVDVMPVILEQVNDSKKLSAKQRDRLSLEIKAYAACWGVGFASADEIDSIGILPATRLAMKRAVSSLAIFPVQLLLDYVKIPDVAIPQTSLVKGDARCVSIAAASILAKTARDHVMNEQDQLYPGYRWFTNKGYGTAAHRSAIQSLGLTPIHRRSFRPMLENSL